MKFVSKVLSRPAIFYQCARHEAVSINRSELKKIEPKIEFVLYFQAVKINQTVRVIPLTTATLA